jgi:DNA-binding transcriptional MocR family regulator
VWVELPRPLKSRALFEEALSHGVCFAPGAGSGRSGRLSCGHGWHPRIEKGVTRLGELATAALARR